MIKLCILLSLINLYNELVDFMQYSFDYILHILSLGAVPNHRHVQIRERKTPNTHKKMYSDNLLLTVHEGPW